MKRVTSIILMTTLILAILSSACGSTETIGDFAFGFIHGVEYSDEASAKYNESVGFHREGLYLKAIEAAEEAILIAPDWAAPYYLRGDALLQMNQYSMAHKYFEKAIELGFSDELLLSNIHMARGANLIARKESI